MYVPFDAMPKSSRIWIYQSDRKLSDLEVQNISDELEEFCSTWVAHQQQLKTSFNVFHNHFIVLAVDENSLNASGCSIDSSVKKVKEIEEKHNISLFNRQLVAFFLNDDVQVAPF